MTIKEMLETAKLYDREVLSDKWLDYGKDWEATELLNEHDSNTWEDEALEYVGLSLRNDYIVSVEEMATIMANLVEEVPYFKNEILANDGFYWYVRTLYDYYIRKVIETLEKAIEEEIEE